MPTRTFVTAGLLASAVLVMGAASPVGMALFPRHGRPWFWAMNAMASALSSASALVLAMTLGLAATIWSAVAL